MGKKRVIQRTLGMLVGAGSPTSAPDGKNFVAKFFGERVTVPSSSKSPFWTAVAKMRKDGDTFKGLSEEVLRAFGSYLYFRKELTGCLVRESLRGEDVEQKARDRRNHEEIEAVEHFCESSSVEGFPDFWEGKFAANSKIRRSDRGVVLKGETASLHLDLYIFNYAANIVDNELRRIKERLIKKAYTVKSLGYTQKTGGAVQ